VLLDRHVVVVEAEPHRAVGRQPLRGGLEQVLDDLALPGLVELLGGLREVAEVGDEAPDALLAPAHDRGARRAGEPGQPAHVDEVRDEQQVQLALGERAGDLLRTVRHASSWARRTSASR
jgi:hypothetical protein